MQNSTLCHMREPSHQFFSNADISRVFSLYVYLFQNHMSMHDKTQALFNQKPKNYNFIKLL